MTYESYIYIYKGKIKTATDNFGALFLYGPPTVTVVNSRFAACGYCVLLLFRGACDGFKLRRECFVLTDNVHYRDNVEHVGGGQT